ncbi:hypothetical protein [Halomonas lysinitropha]|uniref:Uncharacterized protein n=1 Tax=Halomonas lysinitropha TaxID=2607506 RepID=A0A5K1I2E2_9GAMM|nr:hypothetical protein [Halomonas lysinitropha]VVZ95526.1 hypothetical protein HALO32_01597 [Halomonas lysinitropha]
MNLYDEFLAISVRPNDPRKVISLCEEIMDKNDLPLNELVCVLVVRIYKSIEVREGSCSELLADEVSYVVSELVSRLNRNAALGVRTDCNHLYISLLTAKWHLDIFRRGCPRSTFDDLMKFIDIDQKRSVATSQNLSRGALVYSYRLFIEGDFSKFEELSVKLKNYLVDCFGNLGAFPYKSTYVGDFVWSVKMLQCMYAGLEFLESDEGKRNKIWSADYISAIAPRVKSDSFKLDMIRFFD